MFTRLENIKMTKNFLEENAFILLKCICNNGVERKVSQWLPGVLLHTQSKKLSEFIFSNVLLDFPFKFISPFIFALLASRSIFYCTYFICCHCFRIFKVHFHQVRCQNFRTINQDTSIICKSLNKCLIFA